MSKSSAVIQQYFVQQQTFISTTNHPCTFTSRMYTLRSQKESSRFSVMAFSTLPSHKIVPMPSLSPTMESGSIAKWNIKEGDRFDAGASLCDVETDKATVSFDATDEGYLAKILVGSGDIKVGQPLMITVDEAADVAAFKDFQMNASTIQTESPSLPKSAPTTPSVSAASVPKRSDEYSLPSTDTNKIFASPLARKLIRESNTSLEQVHAAVGGQGSGSRGRITADDVHKASSMPKPVAQKVSSAAAVPPATSSQHQEVPRPPQPVSLPAASTTSVFTDFQVNEVSKQLAAQYANAKQTVPHYYVSVEINVGELLKIRQQFNANLTKDKKGAKASNDEVKGLAVLDFLVKAAAVATQQVPDINASWMDTFVRRYEQVDINVVMGGGSFVAAPVVKNVCAKGLSSISDELNNLQNALFSEDLEKVQSILSNDVKMAHGTFSIHNLGVYGVKSAAPIILPSQAGALALGAIIDTVVPRTKPSGAENEADWEVAPIMVATLSVDHRVVDGAVAAQWLSAFKQLAENPLNLLL